MPPGFPGHLGSPLWPQPRPSFLTPGFHLGNLWACLLPCVLGPPSLDTRALGSEKLGCLFGWLVDKFLLLCPLYFLPGKLIIPMLNSLDSSFSFFLSSLPTCLSFCFRRGVQASKLGTERSILAVLSWVIRASLPVSKSHSHALAAACVGLNQA